MKTAIVTGASTGLGEEFVRQLKDVFPEIGCVWLIARRRDRLENVARHLSGVETKILPLDLCDASAFSALAEELAKEKPDVALLINKNKERLIEKAEEYAAKNDIALKISDLIVEN